jgi:hypothetical protein
MRAAFPHPERKTTARGIRSRRRLVIPFRQTRILALERPTPETGGFMAVSC